MDLICLLYTRFHSKAIQENNYKHFVNIRKKFQKN